MKMYFLTKKGIIKIQSIVISLIFLIDLIPNAF